MNKRHVVRAGLVTVLAAGAVVGLAASPASAVPKRTKCDAIAANVTDESRWADYYMLLAQGYDAQGNSEAASDNYETATMFNNLALAGLKMENRLGC